VLSSATTRMSVSARAKIYAGNRARRTGLETGTGRTYVISIAPAPRALRARDARDFTSILCCCVDTRANLAGACLFVTWTSRLRDNVSRTSVRIRHMRIACRVAPRIWLDQPWIACRQEPNLLAQCQGGRWTRMGGLGPSGRGLYVELVRTETANVP